MVCWNVTAVHSMRWLHLQTMINLAVLGRDFFTRGGVPIISCEAGLKTSNMGRLHSFGLKGLPFVNLIWIPEEAAVPRLRTPIFRVTCLSGAFKVLAGTQAPVHLTGCTSDSETRGPGAHEKPWAECRRPLSHVSVHLCWNLTLLAALYWMIQHNFQGQK